MIRPHIDHAVAGMAGGKLRLSRWLLFASVPLLLLTLLVAGLQKWSVAQAADPVTVGNCTSDQDYVTIQEAVNEAVSGTEINICPGTYSESVNLSIMGSAISGTVGDITLRKVTGQAGDVLINPLVNSAIYISPSSYFTGNITLESLKISAADADGVYLHSNIETVIGNVVISDIVAVNNGGYGVALDVVGDILVVNSEFSDNDATGFHAHGLQNIDIINSQANNNGSENVPGFDSSGFDVTSGLQLLACNVESAATANHVLFENVVANENGGWGINHFGEWDVEITNTEVYSNAYDGAYIDSGGGCEIPVATISNSHAAYNGWDIFNDLSVDDLSIAYYFTWGGFRLLVEGGVNVGDDTVSNANIGFGYCFYSYGDVNVVDALAENNIGDGFVNGYACTDAVDIGMVSAEAENERWHSRASEVGAAEIDTQVSLIPTFVVTNSSAISNTGIGFNVYEEFTTVTFTQVSATENLTGVAFFAEELSYDQRAFGGDVGIQDIPLELTTSIDNSLIQSNQFEGVYYGQPFFIPTAFNGSTITTTNSVNNSIICENGTGLNAEQYVPISVDSVGVQTLPDYALDVDARGNWWGDLSGPAAADNPTGQGDNIVVTVVDPPTNTVTVAYAPWIDTIDDTASPNPTLLTIPVQLAYQFLGGSYFLENGVGDPNNGPLFTLSATNGTISGKGSKSIVNTLINGTATPTAPGTMTVVLDGPCGLDSTQEILVATPGINVEKTPDAQGVTEHDSAIFTVTVSNSGNVTLTDISVTDTLVPACARATGVLGDLGIGDSASYSCTLNDVQNNITNTVTAQGFALIDGNAEGDAVTDSDTANVYVASFTLTKTVYVDGYNEWFGGTNFNPSDCALESNITVPASTTVKYCYTLTNTGDYPLAVHTLIDSHFPEAILDSFPQEVAPGATFSTIDAGVQVTKTIQLTTTNVATWTAEIAAPVLEVDAEAVNAAIPVIVQAQATVGISSPTLDQDGDGTPDITEGAGDINTNGIPDFLDPAGPTSEPPTEQPNQRDDLFLPSLGNNQE